MIIAIDFDGTCVKHAYPEIGDDIGAVEVLRKLTDEGNHLVLNTMRSGNTLSEAVEWFSSKGIPLYGVNRCPGQEKWTYSPKTYADIYIDDSSIFCPKVMDEQGNIFADWRRISGYFGYDFSVYGDEPSRMMRSEISSIKSNDIRAFAFILLGGVPDYFFKVPASTSGKYHPDRDLGAGGLVRHSISVKRFLDHIIEASLFDITPREADLLRVAALFHDCMKCGSENEYDKENPSTVFSHPVIAAWYIRMKAGETGFRTGDAEVIASAVESHMGKWNKSKTGDETLPLPESPYQKMIHLADYLASRKDIDIDIEM